MSNSLGYVCIEGVVVGYFEYFGTSDVAEREIRGTKQAVSDHWRQPEHRQCTCGLPPTPAMLYSTYGYGYYWPSEVCLNCLCITGETRPWDANEYNDSMLDPDEWPKDGPPPGTGLPNLRPPE